MSPIRRQEPTPVTGAGGVEIQLPMPVTKASRTRLVSLVCFVSAGLGAAGADVMVTTAADENNGSLNPALGSGTSLREAVLHSPAGSAVKFAAALDGQTVTLTLGQMGIGKDLGIDASALTAGITVSGNDNSRVFDVQSGKTVAMNRLKIIAGKIATDGGGIRNAGTLSLTDCELSSHDAGGGGGAIENSGTLSLTACTLDGNTAGVGGGAIEHTAGVLTMTNCTLTGNMAQWGGGIDGDNTSSIRLYSCTLAGNHASDKGGGIEETTGTLLLENSIIAGNTATNSGPDLKASSINTQLGVSLLSSINGLGGGFAGIVASPNLSALGDYGGSTRTMPPQAGSPAINAGGATALTVDQRGLPRVVGPEVDIGAVEDQASLIVIPAADTLSEGSASQWFVGAESATASMTNVTDRIQVGAYALRFSTNGGYDTWAGTPVNKAAAWNLEAAGRRGLAFWLYSESDSPWGFQNNSPWIRLHTSSQSYLELHARRELMNECRNTWLRFVVPFSGNGDWDAVTVGTPDLANVNWIEFHADTWDFGLRYWLDGIDFVPLQATSLSLNTSSLRLWSGYRWQNLKLKAQTGSGEIELMPEQATWNSSNPAVVMVGGDGVLEALTAGTATVTASYTGKTASVEVEVLAAALPPEHEPVPAALAAPAAGALFEIPVLILRYLPTLDGVNLDVAQARDYWTPGEITLAAMKEKIGVYDTRVKWMIEEASRFRGYKNAAAPPSLGVRVVDMITLYEQMPPGVSRQQDSAGNPIPEVDYHRMFERLDMDYYVNDLGVREIWIWNGGVDPSFPSYDPATCRPEYTRSMPESNMSSPLTGDISNSYRWDDLPVYDHTYVVYGQNIRRTQAEAIHNRGHQLEAVLSHMDWLRNGNSNFFWKQFCGRNPDGSFVASRAGSTHYPPNAASAYDYLNPRLIYSDCEDWTPAGTGLQKQVNADTWGLLPYAWPAAGSPVEQKTESQYYLYWMQNMPGHANTIANGTAGLTNWWAFTADWDNAIRSGLGLYGPRAASADPELTVDFTLADGIPRLSTPFQSGLLYRLWQSSDLNTWRIAPSQNWSTSGGTLTIEDTAPPAGRSFYRLSSTTVVEP
jgi:hypothetical protein